MATTNLGSKVRAKRRTRSMTQALVLANYFAGAVLMPYANFHRSALARTVAHGRAWSRMVAHGRGGYGAPRATLAVGLGCPVERAPELVYADGVDLRDEEGMLAVGVTCRLCERRDCEQRVLPSLRQPLQLREDVRGVSMYTDPER